MRDAIEELNRLLPIRRKTKRSLEAETQRLRIKVAALQSKLHGLWTAKTKAEMDQQELRSQLEQAHKQVRQSPMLPVMPCCPWRGVACSARV